MAKLIAIEGTDCSGKGTQSQLLCEWLISNNKKAKVISFPDYNSPTGIIIGGAYLGKEQIGKPIFPEGAPNVDGYVASLLFAADRRYNLPSLKKDMEEYDYIILNRYVSSNLAHQASKISNKEQRVKMVKNLKMLEYDILELPKPDITLFLYMPLKQSTQLKLLRAEKPDQHEKDLKYLENSEMAYLELAKSEQYCQINCTDGEVILKPEQITDKIKQTLLDKAIISNE